MSIYKSFHPRRCSPLPTTPDFAGGIQLDLQRCRESTQKKLHQHRPQIEIKTLNSGSALLPLSLAQHPGQHPDTAQSHDPEPPGQHPAQHLDSTLDSTLNSTLNSTLTPPNSKRDPEHPGQHRWTAPWTAPWQT